MEVNKPGGQVAPTAPVHFFQSLIATLQYKCNYSGVLEYSAVSSIRLRR